MQATQEQLQQHKIPLQYRDYCAHLLIPLNEVRRVLHFIVLFSYFYFVRFFVTVSSILFYSFYSFFVALLTGVHLLYQFSVFSSGFRGAFVR